jgi:hypothetical protein
MPWYQEPNMLSAIGSLGAVLISLVALYVSHRGESAQQLREKREELRGVLERLVSLREEQNALNKERDEGLKAVASAYQNTKRAIYLEAAEALARQIPLQVSAAEYYVLGLENQWESDFIEAEAYYKMAVSRSRHSSPSKQSEILRSLAAIYFIEDQSLRNVEKGRATYRKATEVLASRSDAYSYYVRALAYRNWAASEILVKNLAEAGTLLGRAYNEWTKIPAGTGLHWSADLRNIAYNWGYLGIAYFQTRENEPSCLEDGRLAFREAQKVIEALSSEYGINNDYTIDARALIFQWWGQQEYMAGFWYEGQQLLAQAEDEFKRLSDAYTWKDFRLVELKKAQQQIARGETPQGAPENASLPERLPEVIPATAANSQTSKA